MRSSRKHVRVEGLKKQIQALLAQCSKERLEVELLRKTASSFRQKMDEAKRAILPDMLKFLVSLAMEGERSAVVLGAERINVALAELLKKFLRPVPLSVEKDELFSSDGGALATFARRTEMVDRLGLIDLPFKQALMLVRKLRNQFAHAIKVEKLESPPHIDRLRELLKLVGQGNQDHFKEFYPVFKAARRHGKYAQDYLACIMILLLKLEIVRHLLEPPKVFLPAKLDYRERAE